MVSAEFFLLIFGFVILVAGRNKGPDHNPDANRFTDVLNPVHHHFAYPPIKSSLPVFFTRFGRLMPYFLPASDSDRQW
jgi:hypothetical protein